MKKRENVKENSNKKTLDKKIVKRTKNIWQKKYLCSQGNPQT